VIIGVVSDLNFPLLLLILRYFPFMLLFSYDDCYYSFRLHSFARFSDALAQLYHQADLFGKFSTIYERRYSRVVADLLELCGVTRKNVRLHSASPETYALPAAQATGDALERAIKEKV
jgi:hypothetical protein